MSFELYDLYNYPFRIELKEKHLLVFNKEDFGAWLNSEKDCCSYIKNKEDNYVSGSVSRDTNSFKMLLTYNLSYWRKPIISCQITTPEYSKQFKPEIYGM